MTKIKLGVLFGGRSTEHEVSLVSAQSVMDNLDKDKYEIIPLKIEKNGSLNIDLLKSVDVAFPVLHGAFGEDGSIPGLLKFLDIPFVGPSILGSALGMDKDVTKKLLKEAGINCANSVTLYKNFGRKPSYDEISFLLGKPIFVKPASLGSSVGVSKVRSEAEFDKAIKEAFSYDNKLIIEEFIDGQEVECAVLGNEHPHASILGEIIPTKDFYSYYAKYNDPDGAKLQIPARLPDELSYQIRQLAIKVFKTLECEGMSRVDFFVTKDYRVFVNEINTIPGFTSISMYPKLWEATKLPYSKLLDKLIELAIARHKRDTSVEFSF